LPTGALLLDETHMTWKYWNARPDWDGPRSFTAQHHGAIVAHAAVWPMHVRVSDQEVTAVHLIDWAADSNYAGVGVWLLRQISAKGALMVTAAASEVALLVLRVIGFRPHSEIYQFARPVRPLGQILTAQRRNWKLPMRLLRNSLWCLAHPLSHSPGWSARPLTPEEVPERLWPRSTPGTAVTARGPGLYKYFVDSPSAPHMLFGLQNSHELVGYFSLSIASHVARIADLWLPSNKVEDWCAGYRTAAVMAAREKHVYEISTWASTALGREGLSRAGFMLRGQLSLSLFGEAKKLLEGCELHIQMLDCDVSILSDQDVSYLT